jgi:hypothetical protein
MTLLNILLIPMFLFRLTPADILLSSETILNGNFPELSFPSLDVPYHICRHYSAHAHDRLPLTITADNEPLLLATPTIISTTCR